MGGGAGCRCCAWVCGVWVWNVGVVCWFWCGCMCMVYGSERCVGIRLNVCAVCVVYVCGMWVWCVVLYCVRKRACVEVLIEGIIWSHAC